MPVVTDSNEPTFVSGSEASAIAVLRASAVELERREIEITEPVILHYGAVFAKIWAAIAEDAAIVPNKCEDPTFDLPELEALSYRECVSLAALMRLRFLVLTMAQLARGEADEAEKRLTVIL